MRGRVGVFGRPTVIDCKRPRTRIAPGFRHQAAVTDNRAGAVSAAMEIQQHARRPAAGNDRPLTGDAIAIDRLAFHIRRHRPGRSDFIEALPPLRPADRPRLRAQQCADGVDLAVRHGAFSRYTPVIIAHCSCGAKISCRAAGEPGPKKGAATLWGKGGRARTGLGRGGVGM